MTAGITVVCRTCDDTHRMTLGERTVPCTHCPVPCNNCGYGPYCSRTPCPCDCHPRLGTVWVRFEVDIEVSKGVDPDRSIIGPLDEERIARRIRSAVLDDKYSCEVKVRRC